MRKQEVLDLVNGQIKGYEANITNMKDDKNPQVIEMVKHFESKKEAYEEMLHYIQTGSKLYFSFNEEGEYK